jgi:hypothetical protein
LGCGSSHLCLYSCWDIVYQIGDLLELQSIVQKNSQMLMGTENTMYKGKSLHVHSNNKNHILGNRNGEHTHCFMTHLNNKKDQIHTNLWSNS